MNHEDGGPRTSVVGNIRIQDVSLGSIALIGDAVQLVPRSRIFAVQREIAVYRGDEGNLAPWPIYFQPLPRAAVDELVETEYRYDDPRILVDTVNIRGIAGASIFQVGSNVRIDAEVRIKHFRQLLQWPADAEAPGEPPGDNTENGAQAQAQAP